jgi:hypothetical protein
VLVLTLGQDTSCPAEVLRVFSQSLQTIGQDSISNYATVTSLDVISNWLFNNHPIIRRYIIWGTDSADRWTINAFAVVWVQQSRWKPRGQSAVSFGRTKGYPRCAVRLVYRTDMYDTGAETCGGPDSHVAVLEEGNVNVQPWNFLPSTQTYECKNVCWDLEPCSLQ